MRLYLEEARDKMSNALSPIVFLEKVVSSLKPVGYVRKIGKKELLSIMRRELPPNKSMDPLLLFEEWEPILSKARIVGNYLVRYNFFTDTLNVEVILPPEIIERALEIYSKTVNQSIMTEISNLNFREFETLVQNVFSRLSWIQSFTVTKRYKDGGIDFLGVYLDRDSNLRMNMLGQAKHWKTKVGPEPIRALIGSMSTYAKAHSIGIFVSTEGFTEEAIKAVKNSPFRILTFDKIDLAKLMIKYKIGVKKIEFEGLIADERFWEEIRE